MSSYTQPSPAKKQRRAAPSDGAKQYPKKTVSPGGGRKGAKSKGTAMPSRLSAENDFLDTFDKPLIYNQLSLFTDATK